MALRINFVGIADYRIIKRADILAHGLSDPGEDLIWSKDNSYELDVANDTAAFLIAQGDFATDDDLNFGEVLTDVLTGPMGPRGNDAEWELNAGYLKKFRKALGQVDIKAADIVVFGDSLSEGMYATTELTKWLALFTTRMQKAYNPLTVTGGRGYFPAKHIAAGFTPTDPWVFGNTLGGTVPGAAINNLGLGTRGIALSVAGQYAEITMQCDRFWIAYTEGNASGGIQINIDGGGAVYSDAYVAGAVRSGRVVDSGPIALGVHTIRVSYTAGHTANPAGSGAISLDGIMVFNGDGAAPTGTSGAGNGKGVRVWDGSHFGIRSDNVLTYPDWSFTTWDSIDPDLFIIGLGTNDLVAGRSKASFKTSMTDIVNRIRNGGTSLVPFSHDFVTAPNADIVLLVAPRVSFHTDAAWGAYRDAIYELRDELGVAVCDIWKRLGPATAATGLFYDTIHLNDQGQIAYAQVLAEFFNAYYAPGPPGPASTVPGPSGANGYGADLGIAKATAAVSNATSTPVDVPGVTKTVAVTGDIEVTIQGAFANNTAPNGTQIWLLEDGVAVEQLWLFYPSANIPAWCFATFRLSPTHANHTYKVQIGRAAGTASSMHSAETGGYPPVRMSIRAIS